MSDDGDWDAVISDLYLAAADPEAIARLPGRFTALIGGAVTSLWRLDPRTMAPIEMPATNVPAEAVHAYTTHFYRHDPWSNAVRMARFGTVLRGSDIVDDATLARSLYYNEFGQEHGMFHLVGALVPLGPGAGGSVGVVSVLRPRKAEAFDAREVATFERVLPHLRSAFQLREQFVDASATLWEGALSAALDVMGVPAAVVDGQGTVLCANPLALDVAMLRACLVRSTIKRSLASQLDHATWERLSSLIADAARGDAGGQIGLRHDAQLLLATVSPLPERLSRPSGFGRGCVLLLLRPMGGGWRTSVLSLATTVFGLTRAEAEVACALAEGSSPGEIAVSREVKISTVRTLLERAQAKLGARNLRDLVGILSRLG